MRFGLSIALGLVLLLPAVAAAQLGGTADSVDGSPFNVSVDPQYPSPNSQATLSFLSDTLDLSNATLSITVAGAKVYQGSVRPVALPLGAAGSVTKATVTISSGGASFSQAVAIEPQDVVVVAEPISSAPPLYPGKPLVPMEGDVRVVAVANLKTAAGKPLDPATLAYAWTVDDTHIADSSGIGKESIIVASPLQYRGRDVSVAITSPDGTLVGGATLSLAPQDPSLRIYENDPLLGIRYDHALSNTYNIAGSESTLYAAPFSLPTTNGSPSIQWFLNGDTAQTGPSITLRPAGSGQGDASLSLVASSGGYTTATTNLSLTFGAAPSSNFFGL